MLKINRAPLITSFFRSYFRKFSASCRLCTVKPNTIATQSAAESAPKVVKDIILYKYEKPRFFRNLNIFAISQYGAWIFICYCSLDMVDIPVTKLTKEEEDDLPFWRKVNLGQSYYKYGLTVGSLLMGCAILCVSWTYILKSVRYLVLRKDGRTVAFVTYTPFGRNRIMDVPLNKISAEGSRASGISQMPVKVKGKGFYYLINLDEGKFPNPQLFDRTVGLKRKL